MKISLCITLLVLVTISAFPTFCESQITDTTFVKKLAHVGIQIKTIKAADGGYVSLSQTGSENFIVRKVSESGEKIWQRTISFSTNYEYSFADFAQTSDGGYILAGKVYCDFFYCFDDYFRFATFGILVKLRSNGDIDWTKDYYPFTYFDLGYFFTSVFPVSRGGFVATSGFLVQGYKGDVNLVKFNSEGGVVWTKSFVDSPKSHYRLVSGSVNGFIVVSGTPKGVNVIKLNDAGNIVWKKSIDIPDFVFQTVALSSDNGLIIASKCGNCNQLSLVHLKADGTVNWKAKYSLRTSRVHSIRDLIQTSDRGYAITGTIGSNGGESTNAFLLKVNSARQVVFLQASSSGGVGGASIFHSISGYLLFRPIGKAQLISSVDSNGIIPGCNIFSSLTATPLPFGQLRVDQPTITKTSPEELWVFDFDATSVPSNSPESTVCQ